MVDIMKTRHTLKEDLIFKTEVQDSSKETDFIIELFPYSTEMDCLGAPSKVIHNFDELIEFFEEEA